MPKQDKMTFAKKYGLEGKGRPVRIDPQTASFVKRILKKVTMFLKVVVNGQGPPTGDFVVKQKDRATARS